MFRFVGLCFGMLVHLSLSKIPFNLRLMPFLEAKLEQYADLLESGERNSRGHACARRHSSETEIDKTSVNRRNIS